MSKLQTLKRLWKTNKPAIIVAFYNNLVKLGITDKLPDKTFLKISYRIRLNKKLDLNNPKLYNEKLNWLKLYDRNPQYIQMVDKIEAKKYVEKIVGDKFIIPTLGIWDSFDEIDFSILPNQFVLKCSHDCGSVIICKDKNKFDIENARKKINKAMKKNLFYWAREWPYKFVKPRILAERYLGEIDSKDCFSGQILDYKIFNFSGEPRLIQVDYDRFTNHKRNLYSTQWKYIKAEIEFPTDEKYIIQCPDLLEEMLNLARKLSVGIPTVRTDFYYVNNHIFFGEFTFYHGAGFEHFKPEKLEYIMGKYLILPDLKR